MPVGWPLTVDGDMYSEVPVEPVKKELCFFFFFLVFIALFFLIFFFYHYSFVLCIIFSFLLNDLEVDYISFLSCFHSYKSSIKQNKIK